MRLAEPEGRNGVLWSSSLEAGGDILWPIYFMNINGCVCCAPLISGEPGREEETKTADCVSGRIRGVPRAG